MIATDLTESDLIQRAVSGDRESTCVLVEMVRARVLPYFCRVLLNEDRAQELTQEAMVSIVASMQTLKHVDRFWPWVFRIASNQLRQYYRSRGRRRESSLSTVQEAGAEPADPVHQEMLADMSRRELAELTRQALGELTERHRMVLAMRFYENMPHAEVARVLGCTELVARMIFFRAKGALLKRLKHRGIRDASVLTALLAFGEMTTSSVSQAATVSVSAAVLGEGAIGGLLSCKPCLGAAAMLLLAGAGMFWASHAPHRASPPRPGLPAVRSLHFTQQSLVAESVDLKWIFRSKGAYEEWYHFPEGLDGPFLRRMQRWDPRQQRKLCWWIQNEDANYYVYSGDGTVYVNNARLYSSSLQVKLLPTDPADFCAFVMKTESQASSATTAPAPGLVEERDPATGFLVRRVDRRFAEIGPFETRYEYSRTDCDPALYATPKGTKVVDERDAMHRRGWTYFRVQGQMNGHKVTGGGRLPFTWSASRDHPAWLQLHVEDVGTFCDGPHGAALMRPSGAAVAAYAPWTLFKGLARPWIGFHAMDSIRRDAAEKQIAFNTQASEPLKTAEVTLVHAESHPMRMARYHVDVENDLITQIQFWSDPDGAFDRSAGELKFEYLQEIDAGADAEFVPVPLPDGLPNALAESPGPLWPLLLTEKN